MPGGRRGCPPTPIVRAPVRGFLQEDSRPAFSFASRSVQPFRHRHPNSCTPPHMPPVRSPPADTTAREPAAAPGISSLPACPQPGPTGSAPRANRRAAWVPLRHAHRSGSIAPLLRPPLENPAGIASGGQYPPPSRAMPLATVQGQTGPPAVRHRVVVWGLAIHRQPRQAPPGGRRAIGHRQRAVGLGRQVALPP